MSGQTDSTPPAVTRHFRARAYDTLAASPLILWLLLGVAGLARQIDSEMAEAPLSLRLAFQIASEVTTVGFLALQIVFLLVRRLPAAKEPGIVPRLVAAAVSNGDLIFLAIPRVPKLSLAIALLSYVLVTTGMLLSIVVMISLGRSFSIFPQARKLVTTGPYKLVRHPLYLSEFLSSMGGMWQFSQPWAGVVALAIVAAQFPRMYFEEDVLGKSFAEYATYAARTKWRLIPFVY